MAGYIFFPEQNGHHFAEDIVQCFVRNDKKTIEICFKGPNDNSPRLVHVIARCLTADKLLPEPMLTKIYDALWCH